MRLAIVFAVCAVGWVSAQTPVRDPAQRSAPVGTGEMSGVVRDEKNEPLRRATISVTGDMGLVLSAVTDDAGRFEFVALPAGRFTLTASKAAYPATSYGAKRPNRPGSSVSLSPAQKVTDLKLTLGRGGALAGVVYDERGQPMPGVPIMAWEVRTSLAGDRILDMPATGGVAVTSDDRGAYRVFGLPPGEYTVGTAWFFRGRSVRIPSDAEIRAAFQAASQPAPLQATVPRAPRQVPREADYSPVFMPDSVDPMRAATVQLAAGEEKLNLDLHMQFAPMSKIEGVIVDDTGPVQGASFQIARQSVVQALNSMSVYPSLPNGKFTSDGLGPGTYSLTARLSANGSRPALWAAADVTVAGAETIPITLKLKPAMSISGHVVATGREGAPAFDASNVLVSLLSVIGPSGQGGGNGTAKVDSTGALTIAEVIPGRVRVSASLPGAGPSQWILQRVMFGDRDVTDQPFEIQDGAQPALTITFSDQVSELSGALIDTSGTPAADYFVVVVPADRKFWTASRRIASTRPDVQGKFVFRSLPPGDYRVAVTTDLVPRDLQDVNALVQLMEHSAPVTVGVGEKKVFDMRLGDR
jgi:hypothetical protein